MMSAESFLNKSSFELYYCSLQQYDDSAKKRSCISIICPLSVNLSNVARQAKYFRNHMSCTISCISFTSSLLPD